MPETTAAQRLDPEFLWRLALQKDAVNDTLRAEIAQLRAALERIAEWSAARHVAQSFRLSWRV